MKNQLLNKTNVSKVQFADFCIEYKIRPFDLAQLCQLVEKRARMAVRDANRQMDENAMKKADAADEKLMQRIIDLGNSLGLNVEFNSIWATVHQGRRQILLPVSE